MTIVLHILQFLQYCLLYEISFEWITFFKHLINAFNLNLK